MTEPRAPDSHDNVSPSYWADPYYQSEAYRAKLAAAHLIEDARQALMRKEATPQTLAYARFLLAVENDATLSHGAFKPFSQPKDEDLLREFPFLAPAITPFKEE